MNNLINYQDVKSKIIEVRGERVLLDRDVAELYGVETKHINQAVKNNMDKFPDGYLIDLCSFEWDNLKSNFLTSSWGGSRKLPTAFTEKGLYMLATILKSPIATQTTIAIVETFAKLRELTEVICKLPEVLDESAQEALMLRGSVIFYRLSTPIVSGLIGR